MGHWENWEDTGKALETLGGGWGTLVRALGGDWRALSGYWGILGGAGDTPPLCPPPGDIDVEEGSTGGELEYGQAWPQVGTGSTGSNWGDWKRDQGELGGGLGATGRGIRGNWEHWRGLWPAGKETGSTGVDWEGNWEVLRGTESNWEHWEELERGLRAV